jgi:hypothetical protein
MPQPHDAGTSEPDEDNPLAYELAEHLAAGSTDNPWVYYVDDVFGNVFEYPKLQRLTFWDKANFMGSIDGYTWELERWHPQDQRWEKIAAGPGIYSRPELEQLLRAFTTAGATGPHWVSQTDAHAAAHATRPENRLTRLLQARAQALEAAPTPGPDDTPGRPGLGRGEPDR